MCIYIYIYISLLRGHANILCIVPILADDPRRESIVRCGCCVWAAILIYPYPCPKKLYKLPVVCICYTIVLQTTSVMGIWVWMSQPSVFYVVWLFVSRSHELFAMFSNSSLFSRRPFSWSHAPQLRVDRTPYTPWYDSKLPSGSDEFVDISHELFATFSNSSLFSRGPLKSVEKKSLLVAVIPLTFCSLIF